MKTYYFHNHGITSQSLDYGIGIIPGFIANCQVLKNYTKLVFLRLSVVFIKCMSMSEDSYLLMKYEDSLYVSKRNNK